MMLVTNIAMILVTDIAGLMMGITWIYILLEITLPGFTFFWRIDFCYRDDSFAELI